jgi:hypothetical protein
MFSQSKENLFLFDILRRSCDFITLGQNHPTFLAAALLRNPTRLTMAATDWKAFAEENFLSKGLPVPHDPQYIQIQEALRLCRFNIRSRIWSLIT